MIKTYDLKKTYSVADENNVAALDGVTLEFGDGELVFIMGKSGSGKSTLLHILGGLDKPDSGRVFYGDTNISDMNENTLSAFRRKNIGFVFQQYYLIPELTAEENIKYPVYLSKKAVDGALFKRLVDTLELSDRLGHMPSQLSGGQQQRVAIARALITDPSAILCDEPTGNLDSASSAAVQRLLRQINSELGKTVIIVTHDTQFAEKDDRIIRLCDGKVVE